MRQGAASAVEALVPTGAVERVELDLAGWLGFKTPRMIRKLVKRMVAEGKLRALDVRSTVERTQMPTGGTRETTVNEFWLTREQTLLVATQSDTPFTGEHCPMPPRPTRAWSRALSRSPQPTHGGCVFPALDSTGALHARRGRQEPSSRA